MLGFDVLSESHQLWNSEISGYGYGYSFKTSLLWKPTNSFSVGLNFGFISNIDYVIKNQSESDLKILTDSVGTEPNQIPATLSPTEFKRKGSFPFSYSIKVGYKIHPNVGFDLSIERENWDFIESDESSVFNIRFRSSFQVLEQIVLNIGYSTQNNPFWGNTITYGYGGIGSLYKNLQYFNFGVDYLITDSIVLNLSVFDSNQLSEDKYGQTYFSSAISIEL